MADATLHPRKVPRQARAAVTLEVILEAAARVLSEESLAGFNTNRVAQVAGVSVGSVYQYFPNKQALVAALISRAQASLADAVEHAVAAGRGKALATVLSQVIKIAVNHQFGSPVFAAALDHEERRLPLDAVLGAAQARIVAAVQALLHHHPELAGMPLPRTAAGDCLVIAKALIEAEATRASPNVRGLRQRVLRALQGYLLFGRARPKAHQTVVR